MKPRSEPELTAKWIIERVLNTSALLDGCERLASSSAARTPRTAGAGRRLVDETIGRHVANEERLLSALTQAGQKTLDALLKKLIAGL